MDVKNLKIPAIILAIGLVLALAACVVANIVLIPTVTEHDFRYAVTYKLAGETKTLEGIYRCSFDDGSNGDDPSNRYYTEEYVIDGVPTQSHTYTIAQKDGAEIYIVTVFNACYLMGDTKSLNYEPIQEAPYLEALDKEGYPFEEGEMPSEFTAEIISWEYPEPIENTFVFDRFSVLHAGSMLAMLAVGLLTIVACLVFVKKELGTSDKVLDKVSVLMNFAVCFLAIPLITILTVFMQLVASGEDLLYQFLLCIPALTAFTVAASVALRRKGFTMTGFFVQFAGPVLFFAAVALESLIYNVFG